MEKLNTALRVPTQSELSDWWRDVHIIPMRNEREHYRAQILYDRLCLDWRDPEHKAHVKAIVAEFGRERKSITGVRETND